MHLKTIMLLIVCATVQLPEIGALKRIKRQFNLATHNNQRIKEDFVMLPNGKQDHEDTAKENLQSLPPYNENGETESNKKRNASRNLVEVLRKTSHREHKEGVLEATEQTTTIETRALNTKTDKRCHVTGIIEKHSQHHKNKHFPHSTGILTAKILIPSQHIKPAGQNLGSFGSMNLNNMITYKVGIDSAPVHFFYPKMLLTQNSPDLFDEEPFSEPSLDYYFNSFTAPKTHSFYRQAFQQSNSPIIEGGWQSHATVKEPTQLATLMQNALDTLLANSEKIGGDKSEQQIEYSCPAHQAKDIEQTEGDKANVIQVCSCRLIKKQAKGDEMKKLK